MTPLPEHEYFKESISIAIEDMAETLALNYESYGSTTWRRQAKQAGLEPDNCFYFQNEARIRGKLQFNLKMKPRIKQLSSVQGSLDRDSCQERTIA